MKSQDLLTTLNSIRDHIRFNTWKNDPRSTKRATALKEIDDAIHLALDTMRALGK